MNSKCWHTLDSTFSNLNCPLSPSSDSFKISFAVVFASSLFSNFDVGNDHWPLEIQVKLEHQSICYGILWNMTRSSGYTNTFVADWEQCIHISFVHSCQYQVQCAHCACCTSSLVLHSFRLSSICRWIVTYFLKVCIARVSHYNCTSHFWFSSSYTKCSEIKG